MTAGRTDAGAVAKKGRRMRSAARGLFGTVFPTVGTVFCMLFFLLRPEVGRASVLDGLRLAGLGVLPAVFPFLVLSDLLISGGGLPRALTSFAGTLFRLPGAGGTAILLGWLCGFPIGARCAADAFRTGRLSREEAERAARIASIPSPAFLIGGVGAGMLRDRGAGLFLFLAALLSATLTGLLESYPKRKERSPGREDRFPPAQRFPLRLTGAVRGSATASLQLCAYVVFFSALNGAVGAILGQFGAGDVPRAVISGLLELSGGVSAACATGMPIPALLLCSAMTGWCGLSVLFQIASVCDGCGFRFGRLILSKALQSAICLILTGMWIRFAF